MRLLFDWVFYGHLWIAGAAAALSWLSVRWAFGPDLRAGEPTLYAMVFLATLSVYTLHRLLSFRRAGGVPRARRYVLVRSRPTASLGIGLGAGLAACFLGLRWLPAMLEVLVWAVPLTVFYLTPPWPGWRRLRDLPYLKVVWVGLAWALVTAVLPVEIMGSSPVVAGDDSGLFFCFREPVLAIPGLPADAVVRFLFVATVALLFDLRDVKLDAAQGVRTLANDSPGVHRLLVVALLLACAALSPAPAPYLLAFFPALLTYGRREEDWYAVAINGLLFLPPAFF